MKIPRVLRTVFFLATGAVATGWVVEAGRQLVREDPFANLRARPTPGIAEDAGLIFGAASVRTYHKGDLVAKAVIGSAEITKDRNTLRFRSVKNGWYRSERGPFTFGAKRGEWAEAARKLTLDGGATAKNRDLDVRSERVAFDGVARIASFPTALTGRVGPGYGNVTALRYALDDGSFSSGAARWEGRLTGFQEAVRERRPWRVSSQSTRGSGKTNARVMVNATATDGEVLVRAPLVVHDTKEDVITATGRVFYYSSTANLVADKVVVYQKERRAVATGNVLMLVKPKRTEGELPKIQAEPIPDLPPDPTGPVTPGRSYGPTPEEKALDEKLRSGKTAREFPMSVSSGKVVYWYRKGERRATIEGSPRAYQSFPKDRWRRLSAATGSYDGERDTLTLRSVPGRVDTRMRNSIGDDLVTDRITVSTKEGDDEYETGAMSGAVYGDPEEPKKHPPKADEKKGKKPPPTA